MPARKRRSCGQFSRWRYESVLITSEYLVDKMAPVDVVAKLPSSWFYDDASQVLTLHTSDGRPPAEHEMELIQRGDGIFVRGKHHVTVIGRASCRERV